MKPTLLYALHSGQLYGTERMALATASALASDFDPVILAPEGPALQAAAAHGLRAIPFAGAAQFARQTRPLFAQCPELACMATGVTHSLAFAAWSLVYGRRVRHLHVVHGGAEEGASYGRKRLLRRLPVQFVAVSAFVRERLAAHGVPADRVAVIENFLLPDYLATTPRRGAFVSAGLRHIAVVSRLDPIKRVDLLFDALDAEPSLRTCEFRIFGTGWDAERLRGRAAAHPNVAMRGFCPDIATELARADLLLHLCPCEPFGLALLEAMAAGIPVLAPDTGGAASLIENYRSGFHFSANDAQALSARLLALRHLDRDILNQVVSAADRLLRTRFGAAERIDDYRRLLCQRPDLGRAA